MFPGILSRWYQFVENRLKDVGVVPGKSGRHMKYPYTFTAKVVQFPFFYYMKKNWIWMYLPPAFFVSAYFISFIHELANSDANVRNWAETQRKIAEKEAHH